MAETRAVGRPMSEKQRKSRSFFDLCHYGLKMMVRRDIGGRSPISTYGEVIAKKLKGKTATEGGVMVSGIVQDQIIGVKERQKRTIDELVRRATVTADGLVVSSSLADKGEYKEALFTLQKAVQELLGWETQSEFKPSELLTDPDDSVDTFVLE